MLFPYICRLGQLDSELHNLLVKLKKLSFISLGCAGYELSFMELKQLRWAVTNQRCYGDYCRYLVTVLKQLLKVLVQFTLRIAASL